MKAKHPNTVQLTREVLRRARRLTFLEAAVLTGFIIHYRRDSPIRPVAQIDLVIRNEFTEPILRKIANRPEKAAA